MKTKNVFWVIGGVLLTMVACSFTSSQTATEVVENTETPAPALGATLISDVDGMVLVYVPAGDFIMGSDADDALAECEKYRTGCQSDFFINQEPSQTVHLDGYWIDQTEVTNGMYVRCVEEGGCLQTPFDSSSDTHSSYYGNPEFDDYPVIHVTSLMAEVYCAWAGRRLPTEAEWEKAARGPDGNSYPWGNELTETSANLCDVNCPTVFSYPSFNDGYADVAPVGSFPMDKSIYGVLDMAGNVMEWTADWYDVYPGGDANASEEFGQVFRVVRGGAWYYYADSARSANRGRFVPTNENDGLGFRCVTSLP